MAAASRERTFSGTFIVPGVSLNKRLYTTEMIGRAVARMKARIADPDGLPIVVRTHHAAGDDSRLIVARILDANQAPDGSGKYWARFYDTAPARDIAALVQPEDGGPPALRSVSIHGYFLGETRKVEVDGEEVVTSDDLEIDAIDMTATPGVVRALIDAPGGSGRRTETAPATPGRVPVFETWEVPVGENADALPVTDTIAETAPEGEAYTAAQKRDALKAGQAMKNANGTPSYTIKNKSDLRKAIRAVGRGGADHDKIRAHIIGRARALGLSRMIPDNWNTDGSLKEAAGIRFGEIRECYDAMADGRAGFAIDAYNGPVSLTLRAPSLDPSGLRAIAAAAMDAALDALGALDPDFDADIDVPGAPAADSDGDMGTGEAATHTPPDPNDMDLDDIEDGDNPAPGEACPCDCGCAVPEDPDAGKGCPCACGCETCAAATPESAPPPADPAPEAAPAPAGDPVAESAPPPVPQSPVPDAAPVPAPSIKESAVSETETPAVEAATPTPAPQPAAAPQAPMVALTQEQFAQLLAAATRPTVTESAPALQRPAAPASVEPAPAPAAQAAPTAPAAEAQESAPGTGLAETVASAVSAALAQAIPTLRDSIVSQYGLPPRRGFRTTEADQNSSEMSAEQIWDNRADLLLGPVGR